MKAVEDEVKSSDEVPILKVPPRFERSQCLRLVAPLLLVSAKYGSDDEATWSVHCGVVVPRPSVPRVVRVARVTLFVTRFRLFAVRAPKVTVPADATENPASTPADVSRTDIPTPDEFCAPMVVRPVQAEGVVFVVPLTKSVAFGARVLIPMRVLAVSTEKIGRVDANEVARLHALTADGMVEVALCV